MQLHALNCSHASLCAFNGDKYSCKHAPRTFLKLISLPPEACLILFARTALLQTRTLVILKDSTFITQESFFLQLECLPVNSHADSVPIRDQPSLLADFPMENLATVPSNLAQGMNNSVNFSLASRILPSSVAASSRFLSRYPRISRIPWTLYL